MTDEMTGLADRDRALVALAEHTLRHHDPADRRAVSAALALEPGYFARQLAELIDEHAGCARVAPESN
jgi:hypothetical protein